MNAEMGPAIRVRGSGGLVTAEALGAAARVEPDGEPGAGRAVVENNGCSDPVASVRIDGRHVGTVNAIMLIMLVERFHAHGADSFGDHRPQLRRVPKQIVNPDS